MADAAAPSQSDPRPGPTPGLRTDRRVGPFRTLGWAAYLACSWTWCIGMFLPILLVRDFGLWGFIVFAVPNCLGAAAMGWVLSRRQSRDITRIHRPMIALFSAITIAFHYYFLVWLLEARLGGHNFSDWYPDIGPLASTQTAAPIVVPLLAIVGWAMIRRRHTQRTHLLVCSLVSLVLVPVFFFASSTSGPGRIAIEIPLYRHDPSLDLLLLTPAVVFGFLLCPYLDATFLHTRASNGKWGGRAAFIIGFLLIFPVAILLTVDYRSAFLPVVFPNENPSDWWHSASDLWFLALYIGVQTLVTVLLHFRFLTRYAKSVLIGLFPPLLGVALGFARHLLPENIYFGITTGEIGYRLFMSAYGLLFPAYVYLCMIPTADGHAGPTRRKAITWLAACALAAPFFWLGFIEFEEVYLLPGMAIVLAARLLLPGGPIPKLRRPEPNPAN